MRDETGLATSGSIATAWGVEPGQGSDAHRDISTTDREASILETSPSSFTGQGDGSTPPAPR